MLKVRSITISSLVVLSLATINSAALAATSSISFNGPPNTCLKITGNQTIIGKYVKPNGDKTGSHDGTTRGFEAAADTRAAAGCPADYMSQTLFVTNTYAGKGKKTIVQSTFKSASNTSYLSSRLVYVKPKTRNNPTNQTVLSNNPHCLRVERHVMKNGIAVVIGGTNYFSHNTFYGGTNNNC